MEYSDDCGGVSCLSRSCTGGGCIRPEELVPPGTRSWDSATAGLISNPYEGDGRPFKLFLLPVGPGYPIGGDSNQGNNWWM